MPNKTYPAIRTKAKKLGLSKEKQRFFFTPEQVEEIKNIYAKTLSAEIAKRYGCSIHSVYNLSFRLGLKKDKEFLRQVGREIIANPDHPARKYCFKKGFTPLNKGKKWTEFMPVESQKRARSACFKKGHIPKNHDPVGTVKEVKKGGYLKRKLPNRTNGNCYRG